MNYNMSIHLCMYVSKQKLLRFITIFYCCFCLAIDYLLHLVQKYFQIHTRTYTSIYICMNVVHTYVHMCVHISDNFTVSDFAITSNSHHHQRITNQAALTATSAVAHRHHRYCLKFKFKIKIYFISFLSFWYFSLFHLLFPFICFVCFCMNVDILCVHMYINICVHWKNIFYEHLCE